jgi:hypothetical protein
MTAANLQPESDFAEAADYWKLENLYIDLASAKGRGLTPLEKKFLQGLLCGYSPGEIAAKVYYGRSSSAVRVYLSNGLYKYLQELSIRQTGEIEKVKNWSHVTKLLEKSGYRKRDLDSSQVLNSPISPTINRFHSTTVTQNYQDWEERVDITYFLGREEELAQLKQWTLGESCRLVALLGMKGMGKTALAVKLVEQIQENFEYVIWRSLRAAPPPEAIIARLLQSFSQSLTIDLTTLSPELSSLMAILRSHRCLLVLDGFESVFAMGEEAGIYRQGYQDYGEILRRLAQERHLSCCLLTSWDPPQEMTVLKGINSSVQSLYLKGLQPEAAQQLLTHQDLIGSEAERQCLVSTYANNPLIIELIALTIKNRFNRKITNFLAANTILTDDLRQLLDRQFNRLSAIEKQVMYRLAANQRLIELRGIGQDLAWDILPQPQWKTFGSLERRSLIKPNSLLFAQEALLKVYILERLVEQIGAERQDQDIEPIIKQILRKILLNGENNKIP